MEQIHCPKCQSEYTYPDGELTVCSQCFYEWNASEQPDKAEHTSHVDEDTILDANGNILEDGDTVVVIKDLPVKGAPKPIKAGTKVKNIRLRPYSDHNIDCKIDGFGAMSLKSEFVKKS